MGNTPRHRRTGGRRAIGAGLAIAVMAWGSVAWGQTIVEVVRVDEHWELELIEPDGDRLAPQFHTVMSPFGHLDSFYTQNTWNYQELPYFTPGGFQVQGWLNDDVIDLKSFDLPEFSNTAETVTWTQVMAISGPQTLAAVVNANSSTWGAFGGFSSLITGLPSLPNLNEYSPEVSIANSWITYGANRVVHLRITRVDYTTSDGYVYSDYTPWVVALPQPTGEE